MTENNPDVYPRTMEHFTVIKRKNFRTKKNYLQALVILKLNTRMIHNLRKCIKHCGEEKEVPGRNRVVWETSHLKFVCTFSFESPKCTPN